MRSSPLLTLSALLAAAAANAQYFHQGWQPGQPVQLPVDGAEQAGQVKEAASAGWTPPAVDSASSPSSSEESSGEGGIMALLSRLKKSAPEQTFNPTILPLSHTPHVAPLWGPALTADELRALGPTIEDQLGIPRSSVVTAARGAGAVDDSAPWARVRMAGGAAESASGSSGTSRASAFSFDPWIVLVSATKDDTTSTRFNVIFNDTVNAIHPPPKGQETVPAKDSANQEEDSEEDKRIIAEVLRDSGDALKRLRFGHVDYLTQPAASWHWWIWKVPIVLFISPSTSPERAYDIRFWKVHAAPPSKARFISILSDENKWKQLSIWSGKMAPGGERDHIPERLTSLFSYFYVVMEKIPGPVLPIVAAMAAQPLLKMMHRGGPSRTT